MKQYHDLLRTILEHGTRKDDRTGVGTISIFGYQSRYDLSGGFPLVTTKKVHTRSIIHELLWMIRGETNIQTLVRDRVRIWNEWPFQNYLKETGSELEPYSDEWKAELKRFAERIRDDDAFAQRYGDLGPVYGRQWRDFNGIDQLQDAIDTIKTNPHSRRIIVNAWNPPDIPEMAVSGLPPCHMLFQFYVNDGRLSLQLYQRSADAFLGVPFNIASYALLLHMVAHVTGLEAGEFVHTLGDAHIYLNQLEQVNEQLSREPRPLPALRFARTLDSIEGFTFEDVIIEGYDPHPAIKAQVAV